MDEEFEFWHPVIVEFQIGLDGKLFPKEVLCEGHIIYSGRLLCGESREVLKNQIKAKFQAKEVKEKTLKKRVERTKVCAECLRKYRKNGDSAYSAWVEGKPITPKVKLPPIAKL